VTDPDDPRVGHLLGRALASPDDAAGVLVGFPVDEGVRRNRGRPGAAQGPAAIRRCLFKMTPDAQHFDAFVRLLEHTADLGDLEPTGDLEADQAALGELLAPHLKRGGTVVVLGGGHETSFGHFLGYVQAGLRVNVVNWDAHPDVRPLIDGRGHSGSPFRQMLLHESGACTGYTVAGLNPHSTAKAHLEFLADRGGRALFAPDLSAENVGAFYTACAGDVLASFDLDALDQSAAPGVSAPNAAGLSPELWLHAAERAGACTAVRSVDVVELNPSFDRDDQTARLAALTVWRFWRGRSSLP
jgi:formiminoglutamase